MLPPSYTAGCKQQRSAHVTAISCCRLRPVQIAGHISRVSCGNTYHHKYSLNGVLDFFLRHVCSRVVLMLRLQNVVCCIYHLVSIGANIGSRSVPVRKCYRTCGSQQSGAQWTEPTAMMTDSRLYSYIVLFCPTSLDCDDNTFYHIELLLRVYALE